MRQMKKKIIIAILVTLLLTAAVAFAIGSIMLKGKDETISDLRSQIVDTKCIAFASDLEADSIITQNDLVEIKMKLANLASGTYKVEGGYIKHMITNEDGELIESDVIIDQDLTKEDLVGRVVKSNVSANTLVMDSLLYPIGEEPTKDERIQEFNFLQLPSDLVENDYVDIRIQFPTGEDYSVLVGKKVEKIAGENTIFIKMNEEEIMAMGSAIIEAYMQDGVRLYANKYTDPATQLFDEAIVDYVAKYEYAVEKLMAEKIELELRKLVAQKFVRDELYTEIDAELLGLDNKIVGMVRYTAVSGEVIVENDEEVVLETDRELEIFIEENDEKELLVTAETWNLVTKSIKSDIERRNPEITRIRLEDLEDEVLALYAGIEEEYINEMRLADIEEKENVLDYYRIMRVTTRSQIVRTYPVRDEVLAVIKNNPNLLETIKAEFDTRALLNTRVDEYKKLEAEYNAAYDEYTKEQIKQKMEALVDERTGNIEKNLQTEIAAQKAERVSYLESLING